MCHLKDKHSGPCVAISIRAENKGKRVVGGARGERKACLKSFGEMMGFLHSVLAD